MPPGWDCDKCRADGKHERRGCYGYNLDDPQHVNRLRGILQDYPSEFQAESLEESYIKACPYTYITYEADGRRFTARKFIDWTRWRGDYDAGFLPESGGIDDQPALWYDVIGVIGAATSHAWDIEQKNRGRNGR